MVNMSGKVHGRQNDKVPFRNNKEKEEEKKKETPSEWVA